MALGSVGKPLLWHSQHCPGGTSSSGLVMLLSLGVGVSFAGCLGSSAQSLSQVPAEHTEDSTHRSKPQGEQGSLDKSSQIPVRVVFGGWCFSSELGVCHWVVSSPGILLLSVLSRKGGSACFPCRTRVLAPKDKLWNQNPVAKGWQRGQFHNLSHIIG